MIFETVVSTTHRGVEGRPSSKWHGSAFSGSADARSALERQLCQLRRGERPAVQGRLLERHPPPGDASLARPDTRADASRDSAAWMTRSTALPIAAVGDIRGGDMFVRSFLSTWENNTLPSPTSPLFVGVGTGGDPAAQSTSPDNGTSGVNADGARDAGRTRPGLLVGESGRVIIVAEHGA